MSEHRPDKERSDGYELAVEEARPKIKRPPLYRVVLLNDDFTPMEFVVDIYLRCVQLRDCRDQGRAGNGHSAATPASVVV
jgi:ATP-dependent Clp protease adapter protein ClpS